MFPDGSWFLAVLGLNLVPRAIQIFKVGASERLIGTAIDPPWPPVPPLPSGFTLKDDIL